MNLEETQERITQLQQMDASADSWAWRAARLLAALLPILAWPNQVVLRGDAGGLIELEQLIQRANVRTVSLDDAAWDAVRTLLSSLPGLELNEDGQIIFAADANVDSVREHFGYVTMQLSRRWS